MPHLFEPFTLRGVTLRNRIGVSPMCMYSAVDGLANDWHLVHLGARAVGGAGLVITEATAVEPRGRISPQDLGLWSDAHIEPLRRVTDFLRDCGAVPGIQIAHAGRKAGTFPPWKQRTPPTVPPVEGGWEPVAPSPIPFNEGYTVPHELTVDEIQDIVRAFADAARRALEAGFQWLELHGAHGYLIHSFYSPLTNTRADAYGGSFENRVRFPLEVARAVRAVWPEAYPLTIRLSCTDWLDGGWTIEDTVELARRLCAEGIDLIDCSSSGASPRARAPVAPGYHVPFSETIRREVGVATAVVGAITEPEHADAIIREERADIVLLGKAFLRDPYWPLNAARSLLGRAGTLMPQQYRWSLERG